MKNLFLLIFALVLLGCSPEAPYQTKTATEDGYTYEYVTNDPMKTRIYTLENGLKIYLSDYENAPRVQVFIPVKAGGKNDPATNTGLAHYLEHMMFKGTDKLGTTDFATEVVYLDSIETMFNTYATLTDAGDRKAYYEKIDAVSNEAANYAIPNEYDKLLSTLGGKGLNAYTTEDRTVYTVDLPSNELPRFLEAEGQRFKIIVNRLFHTELEAVYEEKNRSLDNDGWKAYEALYAAAFKEHPYGTQTVIGTIDHLKNPSITEIKKYFNTYYRPNNVAICISGDIEFTPTVKLIEQFFGDWTPNAELPQWSKIEEKPISEPVYREVLGPDAESVQLAYRFNGDGSQDNIMVSLIDMLLSNSEAGLIDINLKQKQAVLNAGCYPDVLNDYTLHTFFGNPKQDQSLDEVKDLLLGQIALLKNGDFEDWLIPAVIADFKQSKMKSLESNQSRANEMVMAFTTNANWADYIQKIEKMEKITKTEVIAFANENYNDNYVVVYKKTGEDPNKQQVEKPSITKVPVNREQQSDYYQMIVSKEVPKLKPVYVNYETDITKFNEKGVDVLAKRNEENELFELTYLLDIGSNEDPKFKIAVEYLEYIGTESLSAENFKKELYKLGCSFSVNASADRTYVTLSGLDENMEEATTLFESLLKSPSPDQEALNKMVDRMLKGRADVKKNKGAILWSGLFNYGKYGANNPFTNVLANYQLTQLQATELVDLVKMIPSLPHRILYYGPRDQEKLTEFIAQYHNTPATFKELPKRVVFEENPTDQPKVFWTDYEMVQSEFIFLSKGDTYDNDLVPEVRLFNEYFGGGMNSIVFQEIREAQGLAYAVYSSYSQGSKVDKSDYLFAYIGTQADKQPEAMKAMTELLNNLPESETAFKIAKEAILNKIESERITKSGILWNYISAEDKGIDYDVRKDIYEDVKKMDFSNLKSFHEKYIKDKNYVTVLVGSRDKINFKDLKNYGEVKEVTLEELFGYEDSEKVVIQ